MLEKRNARARREELHVVREVARRSDLLCGVGEAVVVVDLLGGVIRAMESVVHDDHVHVVDLGVVIVLLALSLALSLALTLTSLLLSRL